MATIRACLTPAAIVLVLAVTSTLAAVPREIAYQGVLRDETGAHLNGTFDFTFRIIAVDGGAVIHTEVHDGTGGSAQITVEEGLFSVTLGVVTPFPPALTFDEAYELQVEVEGEVLSPNLPLAASPYALNADTLQGGQPAAGYPDDPNVVFGRSNACHLLGGFIELPINFDAPPIVAIAIDVSLDDNGAIWTRLAKWHRNRLGIECSAAAHAVHWMAIDEGVHSISGKMVAAGRHSPAESGDVVVFPSTFPAPPVVIVYLDESTDGSGGQTVRINGDVTATGFPVWMSAASDGLHWIAMEPGDYAHGRYTWTAGKSAISTTVGSYAFPAAFDVLPGVVLTIEDTNASGAIWSRLTDVTLQGFSARLNSSSSEFLHWIAFTEDR